MSTSYDGRFQLILNGRIENHMDLKKLLIKNGYKLKGDNATEVFANYIHYFSENFNLLSVAELLSLISINVIGKYNAVIYDTEVKNHYIIKKNEIRNNSIVIISNNNEVTVFDSRNLSKFLV